MESDILPRYLELICQGLQSSLKPGVDDRATLGQGQMEISSIIRLSVVVPIFYTYGEVDTSSRVD